jgi:hypothetical protein
MFKGLLLSRWDSELKQPFTAAERSPGRCGGFVLKGPNEGSDSTALAEVQAIYCLEFVLSGKAATPRR